MGRGDSPTVSLSLQSTPLVNEQLLAKVHRLGHQIEVLSILFRDLEHELFSPLLTANNKADQIGSFVPRNLGAVWKGQEQPPDAPQNSPVDDSSSDLLEAIMSGDGNKVKRALENGNVDPNETFSDIEVNSKLFATATPLAVAGLLEQRGIVRMLVAAGASPESSYSFVAGAEGKIWKGTVAHTAINAGNLELLKDLAESKADLNTSGSNGANLVWQACYFGKLSMLEHLLNMGVPFEQMGRSPDDASVSHSPLHVAVIRGHHDIVQALLSAQAQVAVEDGRGRTPLDDAVENGNAGIVHQLVSKNSDVFKKHLTPFDRIIASEDPVLLSKVTQALDCAPSLLRRMSKRHLLPILRSRGDAPIHAMNAIFQQDQIRYWEVQDGKTFRRLRNQAWVSTATQMNMVEGPHADYFKECFRRKIPLSGELTEFMNELFPRSQKKTRVIKRSKMYVPVTAYMCHIPAIHSDLEILMALVACPNKKIFGCMGVRALIICRWKQDHALHRFRACLAVVELINFMIINALTKETFDRDINFADDYKIWLINGLVSLTIWLIATFFEICQFLGYWSYDSTTRYLMDRRTLLNVLVIALTGYFIVVLLNPTMSMSLHDSPLLGFLLFGKWFRMLDYLRQFKYVAVTILPITSTIFKIGPFLIVMAVYLFASVNLFYALNNGYGVDECFFLIYRLVVLADFDIYELEDRTERPLQTVNGETGIIDTTLNPTPNYHIVRGMLIALSFVVGVTMMNLFIAMLCFEYTEAKDNVELEFMHDRASMVLDQQALHRGLAYMKMTKRRSSSSKVREPATPDIMSSNDLETSKLSSVSANEILISDSSNPIFFWYVRPVLS